MLRHKQMLLENKAWSAEIQEADPTFFDRMANQQNPQVLWIGCSDSRVAPDDITQAKPGEIFTHRNIANLVVHTDLNLFSVVEYAVNVLGVTDIVVCGHYGCGGVKAALSRSSVGTIDKWLRYIKDVYRIHKTELDNLDGEDKVNRLIELNVQEQIYNLAKTCLIQTRWKTNQAPYLHGWVFDLQSGTLKSIIDIAPETSLDDPIFEYDNL
ncbi:MAG: carbonic anhydrase [Micavibrio aeruginosavorus]|uniref:Carbonic anhydrase n=1 Tax=Micavibrio aeruginosavorus TaxID=349221 RepID=A0A2W5HI90_9BACT|nr:MAG: carbonic anhydrase [Micavibrio aeruginosavorus]